MAKIITVLDLGSRRIAAAMAELTADGGFRILALENTNSNGIDRGCVVDMGKTVKDISDAMKKVNSRSGQRAKDVMVTIGGADTKMIAARGMVPLARTPRQVTAKDVKRCLDIAAMINLPPDRIGVEKIVRKFYIDGSFSGLKDPVGLYGVKLEVETFVATANCSKIQNITKCIDHAGFLANGVYLSCLASADSVLDSEERKNGTLLIDIGSLLTEASIFKDGVLKSFKVVRDGTSTILDGDMQLDPEKFGWLLDKVSRVSVSGISDFSSIVVTGGGALLGGVIEGAESRFSVPARMGIVRKTGCKLNSQDAIIHTSTIGLMERMAAAYKNTNSDKNPLRRTFQKIIDVYERYF